MNPNAWLVCVSIMGFTKVPKMNVYIWYAEKHKSFVLSFWNKTVIVRGKGSILPTDFDAYSSACYYWDELNIQLDTRIKLRNSACRIWRQKVFAVAICKSKMTGGYHVNIDGYTPVQKWWQFFLYVTYFQFYVFLISCKYMGSNIKVLVSMYLRFNYNWLKPLASIVI